MQKYIMRYRQINIQTDKQNKRQTVYSFRQTYDPTKKEKAGTMIERAMDKRTDRQTYRM